MSSEVRFRKCIWFSPRYGLRTLFAVLTLICIGLGIYTKRARDQKRAVEIIRQSPHGFVQYEDDRWDSKTGFTKESIYPQWLRSVFGEDFFHSVTYVQVEDAELLAQLKYLPNVTRIAVFDKDTSETHVQNLAGLQRLRSVTVQGAKGASSSVDENGTVQMNADGMMTQASNESLGILGTLPSIEDVEVYGKGFNLDGLAALAKAPKLRRVGIYKAEGSFGYWDAEPFRKTGTVKKLTLSENSNRMATVAWDK